MKKIKYYDRINKKYVELEVSDEVANFLEASDRQLKRKKAQYSYYNVSMNTYIGNDIDGKGLTLQDTIAEPDENEVMNCKNAKKH